MNFEALQARLLTMIKSSVQNGELTERGLARMVGISQPHMHHILKGTRSLSVETADRILRRFSMSVMDLLDSDPLRPLLKAQPEYGPAARDGDLAPDRTTHGL